MKKTNLVDKLLKHSGDGIMVISQDGLIVSANAEALDILGFSEDELIGKSYYWFFFNQTPNQKLGELINDGFHKAQEHLLVDTSYVSPGGAEKKAKISTALLTGRESGRKTSDKEMLMIFIQAGERAVPASASAPDYDRWKDIQNLEKELTNVKKQNEQFKFLLGRFDALKIAAVVIVFLVFVYALFLSKDNIQIFSTTNTAITEEGTQERVIVAELDSFSVDINLSGVIEPYNKVTIAAQTSGKVVRRTFNEGDNVEKNDILYQMDTKDLARNVRTARINYIELLERHDELASWDSSLAVMQAKRKFALSKIAMNDEKKKLQETKKLFEKGIIPKMEYEKGLTSYKSAEFDFENAQQSLASEVDKGNTDRLEVLRLKLSNAKEELDEVEARYEATLIRASVAGIVMLPEDENAKIGKFKSEGDMVHDGDLVATIGATESYLINTAIGELNVKNIVVDQLVDITGPGFQNICLHGHVDWIAPKASIEGANRFYPIRIDVDVPDSLESEIRLGMYAELSIHVNSYNDIVTVPIEAIKFIDGKENLYILLEEDEIEERPIQVGYSTKDKIAVTEGLVPGEKVLISTNSVNF
jgi:HlyD family secretion protein